MPARSKGVTMATGARATPAMPTYDPKKPTLCGEIVVNLQIVNALLPASQKLRAWRAPYLGVNVKQFSVLAAQGIDYDASLAIGDTRTAFPVSCAREPSLRWKFNHQPLFTFPMTQEDGLGGNIDGKETRIELQPDNLKQFLTRWTYVLKQSIANRAWSVLLAHPSYGVGVGPENLAVKIDAVDKYVQFAKLQDVVIDDLVALGDFWRGREGVTVTAMWNPASGYSGTMTVGKHAAPHFTLEFGDTVAKFACPGCPAWQVVKNRVTFTKPLPSDAKFAFSAAIF